MRQGANDIPTPEGGRLQWAKETLQLDVPTELGEKGLRAAALSSFFRSLEQGDFYTSESALDAVDVVFGNSPESSKSYVETVVASQLTEIDEIVQWYSTRLGVVPFDSGREELRQRLSAFHTQGTSPSTRNYAEQVLLAAEIAQSPLNDPNAVARQLAQAIFHISAIRSTKRNSIRNRYVHLFRDMHQTVELKQAISQLGKNYQTPNKIFHQPFLKQLTWTDYQTDNFKVTAPVASGAHSVVAYAKDFGKLEPSYTQANSGFNWGWVIFAVFMGIVGPAIMRTSNSSKPKTPSYQTPRYGMSKTAVIVFDKNDPNKYAIDFVEMQESLGRPKTLRVSPEHPGPFVKVPLSEIDPVEVTNEDRINDPTFKLLKVLSDVKRERDPRKRGWGD